MDCHAVGPASSILLSKAEVDGKPSVLLEIAAAYLETWATEENIGLVLVRELDSVENAVKTMNQVQAWKTPSRP